MPMDPLSPRPLRLTLPHLSFLGVSLHQLFGKVVQASISELRWRQRRGHSNYQHGRYAAAVSLLAHP